MKTDGPETDTRKRGAYFVRFRPADGRVGFEPVSEEAPAEVLADLRWTAKSWKKEGLRYCPLDSLSRRTGLDKPGLVITSEPFESKKLPPVKPLEVTFEPIALDETSQTLVELAREAAGTIPIDDLSSLPRDISTVRRFFLRSGIQVVWGGLSTLKLVSAYLNKGPLATSTVFWFIVFLLALAFPIASYFLGNYVWYIVPGGVIVKGGWRLDRMGRAARFTPRDSALVIEPKAPGYKASLIRESRIVEQIRLTTTESIALLGAWQSSITPPELDQLLDLR